LGNRYRFDPDKLYDDGRTVLLAEFGGVDLTTGQEFDTADFGVPDWMPEPYPHPLFLHLNAPPPPVGPESEASEDDS
jgi:hypothetical protein